MTEQAVIPSGDRFSKFVFISALLHVGLVLIFIVKNVILSPVEPLEYQAAARVDLIALPDKINPNEVNSLPPSPENTNKTPAAPEKTKAQVKPKAEPKKVNSEAIRLDPAKSKQSAALDKLKQMSAFEKIQADLEEEKQKKGGAKPKLIKGNQLSSGSQLTGVNRLQADAYIGNVEQQIRQNWTLPQWLAQKNLQAQVRVKFDEKGNLLSAQIVKSSGNSSFDEIVLATVQKSVPVPPPPEKFVRILELEGIVFGFPE